MIQILMPMGGLGQRFRDVGIDTPKPLIEVDGMPMFEKALRSFDSYPGDVSLIVVVRSADDAIHGIARRIMETRPEARIVFLDHDTQGPIESALVAEGELDLSQPVVVMDCDIAFVSDEYLSLIESNVDTFDGVLLSFPSSAPRYSYVEMDDRGFAIRTAEKDPISNHALMGAYYFRSGAVFVAAAKAVMARGLSPQRPEFYMSLTYNELIADGSAVGVATGDFYCFGTPRELEDYRRTGLPINAM
jgi:NDP-sugar pyrophosphorylase family protein